MTKGERKQAAAKKAVTRVMTGHGLIKAGYEAVYDPLMKFGNRKKEFCLFERGLVKEIAGKGAMFMAENMWGFYSEPKRVPLKHLYPSPFRKTKIKLGPPVKVTFCIGG